MSDTIVSGPLGTQLAALSAMNGQLGKSMLVQHFEVNEKSGCVNKEGRCVAHPEQGYHTWHPFETCEHKQWPIFHRNVLLNEVLFEADSPPANTDEGWFAQRVAYNRIIAVLRKFGVKYQLFYGGNKSIHLHLWYDPTTTFNEGVNGGIDPYKVARLTILRELVRMAGAEIVFDASSLTSDFATKGDMVRVEGSSRVGKGPKTWIGDEVPERRPPADELCFPPSLPEPSDFSFLAPEIERAMAEEAKAAFRRAEAVPVTDAEIVEFRKLGIDWREAKPSWGSWFKKGTVWPAGKRHERATMSVRLMTRLGFAEEEIRGELEKLRVHVAEDDYDFASWFDGIGQVMEYERRNPIDLDMKTALDAARRWVELRALMPKAKMTAETAGETAENEEEASETHEANLSDMFWVEPTQEDIDRLQGKDVFWAIASLKQYIVLPAEENYLELLLFALQYWLRGILPPEGLIYILIDGEFSAAKTYLMKILLRLSMGIDITGATEALLRRTCLTSPQRVLAIDEFDDQIRKNVHLEGPMKSGNVWNSPYSFLEARGRTWVPVYANVGGPKILTGAELASAALGSRSIKIVMQRKGNIELVHRKLWGSPEVTDVAMWLKMKAAEALDAWTLEKVRRHTDDEKFLSRVDKLTENFDIPRGKELVYIETLLGDLLGWDIQKVLEQAEKGQFRTNENTDFYIGLVVEVYRGDDDVAPEVPPRNLDRGWRKNEKGDYEVLTTRLLEQLNNRLRNISGPQATISPQRWSHLAREIGFTKPRNWRRDTSRGPWRNLQYLIFDAAMCERLGVGSSGSGGASENRKRTKTKGASAKPENAQIRTSYGEKVEETKGSPANGAIGATFGVPADATSATSATKAKTPPAKRSEDEDHPLAPAGHSRPHCKRRGCQAPCGFPFGHPGLCECDPHYDDYMAKREATRKARGLP